MKDSRVSCQVTHGVLENTLSTWHSASFVHSYFKLFISFIRRLMWTPTIPRIKFKTLICILKSNDQECPNVITWIWFHLVIVFCTNTFGIVRSLSFILWGAPTLTDIDHVNIMKYGVFHTPKRCGATGQGETKTSLARLGGKPLASSLYWKHSSNTRRLRETHSHLVEYSHLKKITWTTALPKRRHHHS